MCVQVWVSVCGVHLCACAVVCTYVVCLCLCVYVCGECVWCVCVCGHVDMCVIPRHTHNIMLWASEVCGPHVFCGKT